MNEDTPTPQIPPKQTGAFTLSNSAESWLSVSMLRPPPRPGLLGTLDHYEILRLIGAGGMGVVFLARDTQDGTQVAIKVLKPELGQNQRAVHRFSIEAGHMQRLDHPNVLRVIAIKEQHETPYFVMPYLERGSLSRLVQRDQAPSAETILPIAKQIAAALGYAHSHGLIHRDLKPDNVLLDATGQVHLTDFGLARTVFNDSAIDVQGEHCEGTAAYMSPAVANGEAEDTRCDIYAFGAVLYEMLTGQPPFQGQTTREILRKIQAGPPTPIRQLNPDASAALAQIADGAMARELRNRYANMADVLGDLERVEKGETPLGPHELPVQTDGGLAGLGLVRRRTWLAVAGMGAAAGCFWLLWPRRKTASAGRSATLQIVRRLQLPGVWRWADAQLGNWHGDREPELFLPHEPKLLIVSLRGQVSAEWPIPEPRGAMLYLNFLAQLSKDGLDEAVVSWRVGKNLIASVVNQNLYEAKRFVTEGAFKPGLAGEEGLSSLWAKTIVDLASDQKRRVLATVGTGFAQKPRGVCCFDWETQKQLWQHPIGPYPTDLVVADLDADGRQEIILGSDAVDNGNRADDGTDDRHSYLHVLAHDGRLLWTRELAGRFTQSHPLFAGGPGKPEVVVWVTGPHDVWKKEGLPETGPILKLNVKGEMTAHYDAGVRLLSCQLADVDRDGTPEVLATDRLGFLHVLNADLTLRQKVPVTTNQYDMVDLRIASISDLNRDGDPEIILTSSQTKFGRKVNSGEVAGPPNERIYLQNSIVILTSKLRPLTRFVVAETWKEHPGFSIKVADDTDDGAPELLCLTDEGVILRLG